MIGIPKAWGGFRSGISTGDRQKCIPPLTLWTFKISSQIKHELMTLLTTEEAGYNTSIDRSDVFVFICRRKPTKRVVHQAPEALTLMNFLSD